ncbi:MAG: LacI family DNA-binding transcriptional regulator [Anaerolineales bacterium]|nr:LacI family DNA-binding transcriptional regulator [Anaerolineales bacterium]
MTSDMINSLTLEMVAEKAGVSRSTVSRVVNNHPNVREDVRERVLMIIKETGYRPHPAARSLASHRTHVIGLVIPRSTHTFFTDPYFPALTEGVAEACNLHDYTLSLFLIKTEEDERRLVPRLIGKGFVDGLIIQATHLGDNFLPQLSKGNVPFLVAGRPMNAPEANFIDVDNVGGAFDAVLHLIQCGRKKIATVTCALNTSVGVDRFEGYKKALYAYGIPMDEKLIFEGEFTEQSGYKAAKNILPFSPDAIFVGSDTMALGVIRAIKEIGLEIPKDISIVGFDDLPPAIQVEPPLTTIRQPVRRFGAKAVETLLDIAEQAAGIPRHIILGTELIVRGSSVYR